MLQSYASEQQLPYEDQENGLDVSRYFGILTKRIYYLVIPFVVVLLIGSVLTIIQRPVFVAEGKILIESQEIPVDLVRPTVSSAASERIQVMQQRIMTRDNLLTVANKYNLFPGQRKWMSATQLLDLMRERTQIKLIEASGSPGRRDATIAFTLGFEYEIPDLAMKVANEFMTLILNEDVRTRTNRASETTKFLSREVARLNAELAISEKQVSDLKRKKDEAYIRRLQAGTANTANNAGGNPLVLQLTALKAELLQKSAIYSGEHPAVKALKQKIAALEKTIATAPQEASGTDSSSLELGDNGLDSAEKQRAAVERSLEEATKKLDAARLGENLERDQQSERLVVIEQPTLPQKPIKPNRMKLFALAFIGAVMCALGAVFAVETIDRTIRGSKELSGIFDSHLIITIPYISTKGEALRRKSRKVWLIGIAVAVLLTGLAVAFFLNLVPTDLSWVDTSWIDYLRGLSK